MNKNNIIIENHSKTRIVLKNVFRSVDFYRKITGADISSLSLSFVPDADMEKINSSYLGHKGSTDVVTFDYSENTESLIDAEIIICTDQAKRNSKIYTTRMSEELIRLVFHGLLHISGYDDCSPGLRKAMKTKEDELINLWNQYNLRNSKNNGMSSA